MQMYEDKEEFVEIRSVSFDAGDFKYNFRDYEDNGDFRGLVLTYSEAGTDKSQEISISNAHVLINLRDFINRMLETYAKE